MTTPSPRGLTAAKLVQGTACQLPTISQHKELFYDRRYATAL
jgi:hypothetical protein